jgi:hypothetical protein
METVRQMAEAGQRGRKRRRSKVRQPLGTVTVRMPKSRSFRIADYREEYLKLLREN